MTTFTPEGMIEFSRHLAISEDFERFFIDAGYGWLRMESPVAQIVRKAYEAGAARQTGAARQAGVETSADKAEQDLGDQQQATPGPDEAGRESSMSGERELAYWKRVASYLASCQAATLEYDGTLSSCSKARRYRFEDMTRLAMQMLDGNDGNAGIGYAKCTTESARQHCKGALEYVAKVIR